MTKQRIFLPLVFCLAIGLDTSDALAVQQTPSEDSSARISNDIQDLRGAVAKQGSWTNPIVLSPIIIAIVGWAFAFYALRSSRQDRETDRKINAQDKETDRKLTERARQLELYRAVYPEKVKAATGLMDRAGKLYWKLRAHYAGAQDGEQAAKLSVELQDLLFDAQASEFLLGEEITRLIAEFRMTCMATFLVEREYRSEAFPKEGKGTWAHEPSYKQLTGAMRRVLHLDTLEVLLPPQATEPTEA